MPCTLFPEEHTVRSLGRSRPPCSAVNTSRTAARRTWQVPKLASSISTGFGAESVPPSHSGSSAAYLYLFRMVAVLLSRSSVHLRTRRPPWPWQGPPYTSPGSRQLRAGMHSTEQSRQPPVELYAHTCIAGTAPLLARLFLDGLAAAVGASSTVALEKTRRGAARRERVATAPRRTKGRKAEESIL